MITNKTVESYHTNNLWRKVTIGMCLALLAHSPLKLLGQGVINSNSIVGVNLNTAFSPAIHTVTVNSGVTVNTFIARSKTRRLDMDNVGVINAQGKTVYGFDINSGAQANITNQPSYIRLRNNSQIGLVISKPVLDGKTRKWSIIFARRINQPDGSFAGMVYKTLTGISHLVCRPRPAWTLFCDFGHFRSAS